MEKSSMYSITLIQKFQSPLDFVIHMGECTFSNVKMLVHM